MKAEHNEVEQTSLYEEHAHGRVLHDAEHLSSEWDALRDWAAKPTLFDLVLKLIRWDQS